MRVSTRSILPIAVVVLSSVYRTAAQTFSQCNPLTNPGACPPNQALGSGTSINFNTASASFSETGVVSYGSDGAQFTVGKSGDNPHITSKWYIMFGHVEFEIKAAPGQGIVSSAVLMSDCLDEIDWEWLGGDDNQVQSNYFRKGQTVTGYNRGAFHDVPGNHDNFHKYAIDWTADQIVWSIDGQTIRVLEATAAQNGDYPQTPMQIKVGAWAGGDPGNPQGTIEWAGGMTDYSSGPFSMYLKSIAVTDYSTGSSYSYSGTTGTWESIHSDGGSINPQGSGQPVSTSDAPAVTSTVPNDSSAPLAFDPNDSGSVYATRTGWPWTGTATASVVPPGWSIDGNGNVHPPSSGAAPSPSSSLPVESSPGSSSDSGPEQTAVSGAPLPSIPTQTSTSPVASGSPDSVTQNTAVPGTESAPLAGPVSSGQTPSGQPNPTASEFSASASSSASRTIPTGSSTAGNTSTRSMVTSTDTGESGSQTATIPTQQSATGLGNPSSTPEAPSSGADQIGLGQVWLALACVASLLL